MKYIKKPIVIEAFELGKDYIPGWFMDKVSTNEIILKEPWGCSIYTLKGLISANNGDMIIKGIKGEIYPCKKYIFDMTYDRFL
jgi:hypothetical protein